MNKSVFLIFLSVLFLGVVQDSEAGTVKGTVNFSGKVNAPVRETCHITSSLSLNQVNGNLSTAEAQISTMEYNNLVPEGRVSSEFGMGIGGSGTYTDQQIEQKLSNIYPGSQQGWTKFKMSIQCKDPATMKAISYRIENANGVNASQNYLAFDANTSAAAKSNLKLQTLLYFPQVGSNNVEWKNYSTSTAKTVPVSVTQYDIYSYHVITRGTDTLQPVQKGDMPYSATESFIFNYV